MQTLSGKQISKLGIGSYGIGGRGHRDVQITERLPDGVYVDALIYTLRKEINFTEISLGYGHGQSLVLFKQALDKSSMDRRDVFLTHSLYPRDLPTIDTISEDIDNFYKIMGTGYADSTLVTQSLILKFGEEIIYHLLHDLLEGERTRYVSLSNASPDSIRAFKQKFKDKFFAHEGHLSFEVRALQDKGVFNTCDDLGVENIIWRPLGRSKTLNRNWKLLVELAEKYSKTQSQIILNWICNLGYRPMVMSVSQKHIDENLSAIDFVMSDEDYQRMTDFRLPNYNPPEIHWDSLRVDDDIVALVNEFAVLTPKVSPLVKRAGISLKTYLKYLIGSPRVYPVLDTGRG